MIRAMRSTAMRSMARRGFCGTSRSAAAAAAAAADLNGEGLRRPLTDDEVRDFNRDGFLFVKDMFRPEEIAMLLETIEADPLISSEVMPMADTSGRESKLTLWFTLGDDTYSAFVRRLVSGRSSSCWPMVVPRFGSRRSKPASARNSTPGAFSIPARWQHRRWQHERPAL